MEQPPFENVFSERVHISQSAVRSVSAREVDARMSAVQRMVAGQATLGQSAVGLLRGDSVTVKNGLVGAAIGRQVTAEGGSTVFLLSPSVQGNVNAVFTLPAAFALGFGYVMGRWLVKLLNRGFKALMG
jgi:hypothetical protein